MRPDEEQLARDELAERRRERDREREPARWHRPAPDHRSRHAQQARMLDLAAATEITAIECPVCLGPVFAVAGSEGETIDCANDQCGARLTTIQTADGVVAVLRGIP